MESSVAVATPAELRDVVRTAVLEAVESTLPRAVRKSQLGDWLSREEAIQHYGVSQRQLAYMREQGTVEYSQHGRRIVYSRRSLEDWIEEGRVPARNGRT